MKNKIKNLAIDATFVGSGGAINHLINLILFSKSSSIKFNYIYIWAPSEILINIPDRKYLIKKSNIFLNGPKIVKLLWCIFFMKRNLHASKIDILYVLNGINFSRFSKFVGISQNLLPFISKQLIRFINKPIFLCKLIIIKYLQLMSYKKSSGFIFLTSYTQSIFESNGGKISNSIVIPHGVNIQPVKFTKKPSKNLLVGYVSPIDTYKNHLNVVRAVSLYNQKSADKIVLHLVGAAGIGYKNVYKLVKANNMEKYVIFHGQLSNNKTIEFQNKMDIIIFASSCENFPITLLETMMLKKPLLCSDIRPMPDILGKNAIYFDPHDINSIYKSFLLSQNKELLKKNAEGAFNIALNYNWEHVSKRTFEYLFFLKKDKSINV